MKVLFDHQIFTFQKFGGISRYFYELLKRFDGKENKYEVSGIFSNNDYYNKSFNPRVRPFLSELDFRGKNRIQNFINKRKSINQIKKNDFDLFHPTYYNTYFLNEIKKKPFILTFHDAINEKYGDRYSNLGKDSSLIEFKKILLDKSEKIISVSENTKKDIIEFYNVKPEKIDVIHLGNSLIDSNRNISLNKIIVEDYVLFVGNRDYYKNFIFFVNSISHLLLKYKLKLVCAGSNKFNNEEINLFKKLKVQDLVIHKPIDNDLTLLNLYQNAQFFCFPSIYEGFGIPILEAFSNNCPILSSNGGSLPEVGADAVVYFESENRNSLENAFETLILNENLRDELRLKGFNRSKEFSWDKTFDKHLEIYKSIL